MFTVAVVEDDGTAVAKLRACLDQYAATHAGVQFDVTVFNDDNTLPMSKGTEFSFFSANSVDSTSLGMSYFGSSDTVTLKSAFTKAGFKVNETLWNYYESGAGKDYGLASGSVSYGDAEDFRINEAPLSALEAESGLLDSVKGTVPVYVLNRVVGEGRDMPRSMYNHADKQEDKEKSYIELDSTETETIKYNIRYRKHKEPRPQWSGFLLSRW